MTYSDKQVDSYDGKKITTYTWDSPDYLVNNQGLYIALQIIDKPFSKQLLINESWIYDQAAIGWIQEVLAEVLEINE